MSSLVNYDGGYARNCLEILFRMYGFEHDDPKERQELEEYLESNYPDEFKDFKEYEQKIEKRTPNIKQMYFDYLDGKREMPEGSVRFGTDD
ncbi:MAG: hypothetical protein IJP99_07045 [Methanobrevibacter sp.]|nr:hypothetical protein [Methanobrevibacter sp.]